MSSMAVEEKEPNMTNPIANPAASPTKYKSLKGLSLSTVRVKVCIVVVVVVIIVIVVVVVIVTLLARKDKSRSI